MADNDRERLEKLRRLRELRAKAGAVNLTRTPLQTPAPAERPGIGARLYGSAEAVTSLGTDMVAGLLSAPVAGLAAIGDAGLRSAAGLQEPSPAREIVDRYSLQGFRPRTQSGQEAKDLLTLPFRKLDEMTSAGAARTQDAFLAAEQSSGRDVPGWDKITALMATGVKIAPDVLSMIVGAKVPRSPMRRARDIRQATSEAEGLGLDLEANYPEQSEQMQSYVDSRFQPGTTPTDNLEGVTPAIVREREAQSRRIGDEFRAAEEAGVVVPSRTAGGMAENLRNSVSRFVLEDMPAVRALLDEADEFGLPAQTSISENMGIRNSAKVPVSDLFEFWQKINANLPSDKGSPQYAALSRMRAEVVNYLNDSMTNDLVSGSNEAITRYKDAATQWSDFKDLFDENRVMRKLQEEDATPEQVRNLIFGLDAIRAPRQAANVVKRLEVILGPDSPEFRAIQQSALTDILMPVLDAEPNWRKVVHNIDDFNRGNPTLARELFDPQTRQALSALRNYANAVQKTAPLDVRVRDRGWERAAAVFAFGNQLSRGAQRVSLITRAFSMLRPGIGEARKNAILSEVLGYDPRQSLFNKQPIANEAAMQTMREEEVE